MVKAVRLLAGAAACAFFVSSPSLAVTPVGNAQNGLAAMKELNLLVLNNLQINGGEVEGKVYVGNNVTGAGIQVGFGNSAQGQSTSSRATLTVGGNLGVNINLQNRSNGGNGLLGTYGAHVVGTATSLNVQDASATVKVGGVLGSISFAAGTAAQATTLSAGGLGSNLSLNDYVKATIGGNVDTVQGGNVGAEARVVGNVQSLQMGPGGKAYIGGNLGNANLSQNQAVEVVGTISGGNLGNNNLVKAGGGISGVNGSNGTTVYAGGAISGNANGAVFNQNFTYNGSVTAPVTPTLANVTSIAAQTQQLTSDLTALSSALYGLTVGSNPSSVTWTGGTQRATFNAVNNGAGYAVFNVNASIFQASEIAYNFGSTMLPVIINVSGANSYTIAANFVNNARLNNQQVIWNFGSATNISIANQFNGSLLAYNADVTAKTIEGSVVAKNFVMGDEIHLGTYQGGTGFVPNVDAVPEPAIWAQMIAGFGIAGVALRRRRRVSVAG